MKRSFCLLLFLSLNFLVFAGEALVILGGISGIKEKRENKKIIYFTEKHFKEKSGCDVYCFDYISDRSFNGSYDNFVKNLDTVKNKDYEKIHFFCFIYGGVILFKYLENNKLDNLGGIVLDRGPLEEKLSKAVGKKIGGKALLKFYGGNNIIEFSKLEYFKVPDNLKNVNIGIIIETKPGRLAKMFFKDIVKLSPNFEPGKIIERSDDFFYINLDHEEMYLKPDEYSDEVLYFLKNNKFSGNADRKLKDYIKEIKL